MSENVDEQQLSEAQVLDKLVNLLEIERNLKTIKKDGGKGGFGTVLFVEDMNGNEGERKKYAVKAQPIGDKYGQGIDQKKLKNCQNEAKVMKDCSHKNIIELRDEFTLDKYHFIQMDLCENSLEGWIEKNGKKKISQLAFMQFTQQIIDGIEYLHNQNFVVRDLSVRNILINKAGVIKLCDFGLAKKLQNIQSSFSASAIGPKGVMAYFAPEVLCESSKVVEQTKEGDIWALGICLKLFGGVKFFNILASTMSLQTDNKQGFPDAPNLDKKCNMLIEYILVADPAKRPNIHQIRQKAHQWFIDNKDDDGNDLVLDDYEVSNKQNKFNDISQSNEQYSQASTNVSSNQYSKPLNIENSKGQKSIFNSSVSYQNASPHQQSLNINSSQNNQGFSSNSITGSSKNYSPQISRLIDFNFLEADSLIDKYTKLLKNNPYDVNCLVSLGFLETRFGCNFKQAEEYFQQARDIDENDIDCLLGQCMIIIQQSQKRKYKLIQNYIDKCLKQKHDYWRIHYYQAWLYFLQQKYQESAQTLQIAIEMEQNSPQLISLHAVLLANGGNKQESIEKINIAIDLNNQINDPQVFYRKGYIYHLILKEVHEAISSYKEALNVCEKDMMTLHYLTLLYNQQGNTVQAEMIGQKALQLYPKSSHINYLVGTIQSSKDVALNYFLKAVELDSGDIDSLEQIAKIYLERNQFTQAIQYYSLILENDLKNVDILVQLGFIEMEKTKRYDNAISYYKKALELNPKLINAEICIGFIYKQKNEDQAAVQQFQKVLAADPQNHRAFLELGIVKMKMNLLDDAIKNFVCAFNLNKDEPISSFQLGFIYKERKQYDQAIKYYANVLRINPNDLLSLLYIGTCEYEKNKTGDKAINYLKKALELNQNLPDAYQMLSDIYFNREDFKNAKLYLLKTLEYCKTKLENTYFQLGFIEAETNKLDDAIFMYTKCLELDPDNINGNYHIAMAYRDKDQTQLAWSYFQKVLSINPKHVSSIFNLGLILHNGDNNGRDAIPYYLKAIETDQNYIVAHYNLGKIHEKNQNIQEAFHCYQKVLHIDKNYKNAEYCQNYINQYKFFMQQMNKPEEQFCESCTIF